MLFQALLALIWPNLAVCYELASAVTRTLLRGWGEVESQEDWKKYVQVYRIVQFTLQFMVLLGICINNFLVSLVVILIK